MDIELWNIALLPNTPTKTRVSLPLTSTVGDLKNIWNHYRDEDHEIWYKNLVLSEEKREKKLTKVGMSPNTTNQIRITAKFRKPVLNMATPVPDPNGLSEQELADWNDYAKFCHHVEKKYKTKHGDVIYGSMVVLDCGLEVEGDFQIERVATNGEIEKLSISSMFCDNFLEVKGYLPMTFSLPCNATIKVQYCYAFRVRMSGVDIAVKIELNGREMTIKAINPYQWRIVRWGVRRDNLY